MQGANRCQNKLYLRDMARLLDVPLFICFTIIKMHVFKYLVIIQGSCQRLSVGVMVTGLLPPSERPYFETGEFIILLTC